MDQLFSRRQTRGANVATFLALLELVRGVDSSSSVSGLLEKGLIEEAGRLDLPGRPVAFRTTDVFLRCFGLSSLEDLPPVRGTESEAAQ